MAVKRGGLGRGLDALIRDPKKEKINRKPDLREENKADQEETKTSEIKKASKGDKKETSSGKKGKKSLSSDAKNGKTGKKTSYPDSFTDIKSEDSEIKIAPDLKEKILEDAKTGEEAKNSSPEPTKSGARKTTSEPAGSDSKKKSSELTRTVTKKTTAEEKVSAMASSDASSDSISADVVSDESAKAAPAPEKEEKKLFSEGEHVVRLMLVEPNREQPRKTFTDASIKELAESIKIHGVIQPLLVQARDDYYEIIAGERRWRAAKEAGLKEIPVLVRNYSNQEAVEVSLIENIQREDLNPIEEAMAYRRLMEDFTLTQDEVAGKVSKSRAAVANSVRLLKLGKDIQDMVIHGELSEGHARTLLAVEDETLQAEIAAQIVKEHLSVRQTETLVKSLLNPKKKKVREVDVQRTAVFESLASNLRAVVGTKVSINQVSKHKGRIEIEYYSDEELERLYELLLSIRGEET